MRKAEHAQTELENQYSNLEIDTMLSTKVSKTGDEDINGTKTFTDLPECSDVPLLDEQLVNKKYIDDKTRYVALAPVVINTTTPTSMFSSNFNGPGLTALANTLKVGQSFSLEFNGFSTTTQGAISTTIITFGNTVINTSSITHLNNRTNYYFYLKLIFTIREVGVNGSVIMQGHNIMQTSDSGGIALNPKILYAPVAINTTIDNVLDAKIT